MIKLMCDCGCGHPITEYDAGQMPVIVRRGSMLMELRVMPGASGARPNIRPFCTRAAVAEGEIIFPVSGRLVEDADAVAADRRVRSITMARLDGSAKSREAPSNADDDQERTATNGVASVAGVGTWSRPGRTQPSDGRD